MRTVLRYSVVTKVAAARRAAKRFTKRPRNRFRRPAVGYPAPRSQALFGNAIVPATPLLIRARPGAWARTILLAFLLVSATAAHGDITGTVAIKGAPQSKDERFYAAASNCGPPVRRTENWKIGPKGELADVVVWVVDPKFPDTITKLVPIPEVEIKQISCRYVPHVIAVKAGVSFKIINGDPTLHNIRAKIYNGPGQPPGDDVFNFGQAYQGQTDERQFDAPGTYTLQCDVHAWMQAWVMALASSCFAVTDADGAFRVQESTQLGDGDYKIDAWHPRFAQTLEQTVHVKGGTAVVNFIFDGAKSF